MIGRVTPSIHAASVPADISGRDGPRPRSRREAVPSGNRGRTRCVLPLLAAAALAGCDGGHGMMMGGQTYPERFESNGERIYFTGTSASGDRIAFTGGNMHLAMMGGGCATCHGPDREGARMMPGFWKVAPALTREALFEGHGEGDGHGDHERYTEETLRRAISRGTDPAGEPLDEAMPRWSMSERDWLDLIAYLRS